jgi:hypothetical protein
MTDDKREGQLARIRALMARTVENGCTEAEAKAAANLVDKLLATYEVGLDELAVREQECIRLDLPLLHSPVKFAARAIAAFCDARTWVNTDTNNIVYLGLEIDCDVAEYLTLVFHRAIERETAQATAFSPEYALMDGEGRMAWKLSFAVGMAARLGERLTELKSGRDFTARKTGFDLVVSKAAVVKEAWDSLGLVLGPARGGGTNLTDAGAYAQGRTAADGVAINQGVHGNSTPAGKLR